MSQKIIFCVAPPEKNISQLSFYSFNMNVFLNCVLDYVQLDICQIHYLHNTCSAGVGKTKKIAKRVAAIAMLDQLKVDDLADQLDEALKSLTDEFSIVRYAFIFTDNLNRCYSVFNLSCFMCCCCCCCKYNLNSFNTRIHPIGIIKS